MNLYKITSFVYSDYLLAESEELVYEYICSLPFQNWADINDRHKNKMVGQFKQSSRPEVGSFKFDLIQKNCTGDFMIQLIDLEIAQVYRRI